MIDKYLEESARQAKLKREAVSTSNDTAKRTAESLERDLLNRVKSLQSLSRKENILTLSAFGGESLGISGDEWDKKPYLLCCQNGVVDLKTGNFIDGNPEDYIKTATSMEWKGIDAAGPLWEKSLVEIFDGNCELADYVQRYLGYCLTGSTKDHVIAIFWGPSGQNGKGTILETLRAILSPLFGTIPSELLTSDPKRRSSSGPTADIMSLRGRRLVWASETPEDGRLDVARIKWLTGSDTLNGRPPHGKKQIEFEPTHKVILMTNYKPRIPASDHAMWKRLHLIPFTLSFIVNPQGPSERKCDSDLKEKLLTEGSGILAWLVKGCLEWQKQGLNPPETVLTATSKYREDEDTLGKFLTECTVKDPQGRVRANVFYQTYKAWCTQNGFESENGKRFGAHMSDVFTKGKDRNGVFYKGVQMTDETDYPDSSKELQISTVGGLLDSFNLKGTHDYDVILQDNSF